MRGFVAKVSFGLVALVAIASSGCQENESIIFVHGALALEAGSCEVAAEPGAASLMSGLWDPKFGERKNNPSNPYWLTLLVGNQTAARGDKVRARTETSNVLLEGAEVTLRAPAGGEIRPTFTAPGSGIVPVGSGQESGYGAIDFVAIPYEDADKVRKARGGYIVAEVRVFGKTLGGQEVESGLFKFPIYVCEDCTDPLVCGGSGATEEERANPCRPGQDYTYNGFCE